MAGRVISRRRLLGGGAAVLVAGGAGLALVEEDVLPGKGRLHRALGLTGTDGVAPAVTPGRTVSGRFTSAARRTEGRLVGWSVTYPPGHAETDRLPVAVMLHGRANDHTFAIRDLGMDRYLAAAVAAGAPPFALAAVDGGSESYWHRRASGDDPQRMLVDEFLPLLGRRGLRVRRFGLYGVSMGGYGALLLASIIGPERIAAVVAISPAVWHRSQDASSVAFDGPEDFRANSVLGRSARLAGIPLRIDCGEEDPFAPAVKDLRAEQHPVPEGGLEPGAHEAGYWRRMAPAELTFLATHL